MNKTSMYRKFTISLATTIIALIRNPVAEKPRRNEISLTNNNKLKQLINIFT